MNIEELTKRYADGSYPNIKVLAPNDTLPVTIRSLEKGDMQVLASLGEEQKIIARITPSAFNIDKLLRTCGDLQYNVSETEFYKISKVEEYLECICK